MELRNKNHETGRFFFNEGQQHDVFCLEGKVWKQTLIERNQWSTNGTEIDHAFDFFVGFLVGCLILQVEDEGYHHFKCLMFARGQGL